MSSKKHILFLLALISSIYSFGQNRETDSLFLYPQKVFDSDTCCWRKLSAEKKYGEAARLIIEYLQKGKPANKHSLNWHAGQLFAMNGENKPAKKYFRKTFSVFYKWFGGEDGKTWYYYAKGTIAFIDRDKPELEKIILKWQKKFTKDKNYQFLCRMLENWEKPYAEI